MLCYVFHALINCFSVLCILHSKGSSLCYKFVRSRKIADISQTSKNSSKTCQSRKIACVGRETYMVVEASSKLAKIGIIIKTGFKFKHSLENLGM